MAGLVVHYVAQQPHTFRVLSFILSFLCEFYRFTWVFWFPKNMLVGKPDDSKLLNKCVNVCSLIDLHPIYCLVSTTPSIGCGYSTSLISQKSEVVTKDEFTSIV